LSEPAAPRVFISYSHDSEAHGDRVLDLADRLRRDGIVAIIDRYLQSPAQGWPAWCETEIDKADFVLIVCTETYLRRVRGEEAPGVGHGVLWEARLIRQDVYDAGSVSNKYVPVLFADGSPNHVPRPVRGASIYNIETPDGYEALKRLLTNQPLTPPGPVGPPETLRPRQGRTDELPTVPWPDPLEFRPSLADRLKEWPAIIELLAGRARERVLLFEGPSGLGKSALIRHAAAYARRLGIRVVHLDFKGGGLDVEGILGQFDRELGQSLPNFSREGASKSHLLCKDLGGLRQPVLVIFDSYEGCAGNKPVVDWLDQQFLAEVETALGLAVIVAGQRVCDYNGAPWQDQARHFPLKPITEIEHWEPWVEQHYPDFRKKGADLNTILMLAEGNPAVVSSACETISKI
jgi:hypothetical protein